MFLCVLLYLHNNTFTNLNPNPNIYSAKYLKN